MSDVLGLTLAVSAARADVVVRFVARTPLHSSLRGVLITVGGRTAHLTLRDDDATGMTFTLPRGEHQLTMDMGGVWPSGMVMLPPETIALTSILPPLVDTATGQPDPRGRLLAAGASLPRLRRLPVALLAHNPQLVSVDGLLAGAVSLRRLPEGLFYPLNRLTSLVAAFRGSGLREIPPALFEASPLARDFTSCFEGCRELSRVPPRLFAANPRAAEFAGCFRDSGLTELPEDLFVGVARGGNFDEAFARCPLSAVPERLLSGLRPGSVDGMFSPARRLPGDPIRWRAAPLMPERFLRDTVMASGVPSRPRAKRG